MVIGYGGMKLGLEEGKVMDFKEAAEEERTCSDCKYFQMNAKVPNVYMGYLCMNEDAKQYGYYGKQSMNVDKDFLCNRFEIHVELDEE